MTSLAACPYSNAAFLDGVQKTTRATEIIGSFWGKPGLIRRDGIHPTLEGAALISRNMDEFVI